MSKKVTNKKDNFPFVMRTDSPYVMTRAMCEKLTPNFTHSFHIPATCPRDEQGSQSGPQ